MYSKLHDTHLHLDLYDDISQIIAEIENLKVSVFAVTNLPVLFEKLRNNINSKYINIALGFHPELILDYKKYIPKMWEYLDKVRFIGEVGLDFNMKSKNSFEIQINFLKELIIRCNSFEDKILSVHSRNSEDMVLDIIGNNFKGKVILHWYTGKMQNLERAIQYGYYFSINSAMLRSEKGKKIIRKIPIDRILLESDGPFVKLNNYVVRPANLLDLSKGLSELLHLDNNVFNEIINENFNGLIK